MDYFTAFFPQPYAWLIIASLIFVARIMDVSIGTMRIIFVSKGLKLWAPILGFFEVLIWLLAIREILQNLDNPLNYFAYAGGFATGNFVGMAIEHKLAMGKVLVRVITRMKAGKLIAHLRGAGYTVTDVSATGNTGPVEVLFTIVKRREIQQVVDIIKSFNPQAFYTIEDVNFVSAGGFARLKQRERHHKMIGLKRK